MGVKVKYDLKDFKRSLMSKINDSIIEELEQRGKFMVDDILARQSWIIQTGTLNSSIGGVVAHKGEIVREFGFKVVKDGSKGAKEGLDYATSIAKASRAEYICVVVAGAYYAPILESKGYNVISATDILIKGQSKDIKNNIINKVNDVE